MTKTVPELHPLKHSWPHDFNNTRKGQQMLLRVAKVEYTKRRIRQKEVVSDLGMTCEDLANRVGMNKTSFSRGAPTFNLSKLLCVGITLDFEPEEIVESRERWLARAVRYSVTETCKGCFKERSTKPLCSVCNLWERDAEALAKYTVACYTRHPDLSPCSRTWQEDCIDLKGRSIQQVKMSIVNVSNALTEAVAGWIECEEERHESLVENDIKKADSIRKEIKRLQGVL